MELVRADEILSSEEEIMKTSKTDVIYQFKITLNHVKPPVWRRFLAETSAMTQAMGFCVSLAPRLRR